MLLVPTNAAKFLALAALTGGGGMLVDAVVHLFSNDFVPTDESVIADFTESDYGGYASQVVGAWGAPFVDLDGDAKVAAPSLQFQPTDSVSPEVAYGWYLTQDGAPTVVLCAGKFDTSVPMLGPESAAIVVPEFPFA